MTRKHGASRTPVAIGLRALRGGAVTVAVALENGEPRIALSRFLDTAAPDDRLSREPYHVAYEMAHGPDPAAAPEVAAAVAEGRKRQDALAAQGLAEIVSVLSEAAYRPVAAALLVNRADWVTDLLSYSLAFADHPPVAEGLAVRDALRAALSKCAVPAVEVDEKSLPDLASQHLGLESAELDARMKSLGASAGRPWRKEQKVACLAAWVTLATSP